jgi:hypothetical protein
MTFLMDVGNATTSKTTTLKVTELNNFEKKAAFVAQFEGNYGARLKNFNSNKARTVELIDSGISYSLVSHDSIAGNHVLRMRKNLAVVLAGLAQSADYDLAEWPVTIYIDKGKGSAGYLIRQSLNYPEEIGIFFGLDVYEDKPSSGTSILANYLYNTGKKVGNASLLDTRIQAMIAHEFGHVFHQLHRPSHYVALSKLSELYKKSKSEFVHHSLPVRGKAKFFGKKTQKQLDDEYDMAMDRWQNNAKYVDSYLGKMRHFGGDMPPAMIDFGKGVAGYVQKTMGGYASERAPEVVAEGFAGLMMGVSLGSELQQLYETFGGYVPSSKMKLEADLGYSFTEIYQAAGQGTTLV